MREAGLGSPGDPDYTRLAIDVVAAAKETLSDEDRFIVTGGREGRRPVRRRKMTSEEGHEDEDRELPAAVELLSNAGERVDLYGMGEAEADLYLSTHYSQVIAHDTLRLSVLVQLIEQGGAEEIAGGYVSLTDDAVKLLRKMARGRSLNPLRTHRPNRQFAKGLLREWEDAGKVPQCSFFDAADARRRGLSRSGGRCSELGRRREGDDLVRTRC